MPGYVARWNVTHAARDLDATDVAAATLTGVPDTAGVRVTAARVPGDVVAVTARYAADGDAAAWPVARHLAAASCAAGVGSWDALRVETGRGASRRRVLP